MILNVLNNTITGVFYYFHDNVVMLLCLGCAPGLIGWAELGLLKFVLQNVKDCIIPQTCLERETFFDPASISSHFFQLLQKESLASRFENEADFLISTAVNTKIHSKKLKKWVDDWSRNWILSIVPSIMSQCYRLNSSWWQ